MEKPFFRLVTVRAKKTAVCLTVPREICVALRIKPGDTILLAADEGGGIFYRVDPATIADMKLVYDLRDFMTQVRVGRKPKRVLGVRDLALTLGAPGAGAPVVHPAERIAGEPQWLDQRSRRSGDGDPEVAA